MIQLHACIVIVHAITNNDAITNSDHEQSLQGSGTLSERVTHYFARVPTCMLSDSGWQSPRCAAVTCRMAPAREVAAAPPFIAPFLAAPSLPKRSSKDFTPDSPTKLHDQQKQVQ